jgi:hypothetical protein
MLKYFLKSKLYAGARNGRPSGFVSIVVAGWLVIVIKEVAGLWGRSTAPSLEFYALFCLRHKFSSPILFTRQTA